MASVTMPLVGAIVVALLTFAAVVTGTWHPKFQEFTGPTSDDVVSQREAWISDYLHPKPRGAKHRTATGMDKAREKNNRLNKGIMLSLSDFVHRLHDAGGKGRYNEKIAQTMTVVATSVSQAAMYAKVRVKDVANALGLDARLISKCQERFNALANDGEWECLFDDRCAVRSDLLDEKWVEHALLYWMDPDLGFVHAAQKR